GQSREAGQRRAVLPLLKDADANVRFHAAAGLLLGGERAAVPALISLLTDAPPDLAWKAEDYLFRLADDKSPGVWIAGGDAKTRQHARKTWEDWWKTHAERVDLAKVKSHEFLGLTLIAESQRPDGSGKIFECGRDGKPRWEIKVKNPGDARWL